MDIYPYQSPWRLRFRAVRFFGMSVIMSAAGVAMAQPGLDGMADTDGDGVISREEFLERRSGQFPALDTDQSGGLSLEEFSAALENTPLHRFRGRAFKRADTDGSGEISLDEWDSLPTRGFDRLDRNGDGMIDSTERPERTS
ncbi:MAG: EF-hand domain-containing protein [Pseudomonadota bacterium]